MNLMINGIDAMRDVDGPRELVVKSERGEDQQALVSVSDTGVGLPQQQADQIFNAFFTTKSHGTGMGLRISRSIVESHGGRLWAAENSPRGASFTSPYLPKPRRLNDGRRRPRVFVIDDDAAIACGHPSLLKSAVAFRDLRSGGKIFYAASDRMAELLVLDVSFRESAVSTFSTSWLTRASKSPLSSLLVMEIFR